MRAVRSVSIALIALASTVTVASAQEQMQWQPNLETAQQVAAKTNRLVLIHFWAPWCQPCMRLERDVFSRPDTARALEANFVCVKLNTDEAPGTTRMYGVSSLPTDVVVLPNGRLVSQFQSPPTAQQYIAQLNQVAAGHRELARKTAQQAYATQSPAPGARPIEANPGAAVANGTMAAVPSAQAAANTNGNFAPAAQGNFAPPAQSAAPVDRYAEYFQPPSTPTPGAPTGQALQQPPATAAPQAPPGMEASPYAAGNPTHDVYNAHASYQQQAAVPQLPPGCPMLALDGNCPVTLVERMQWAMGDKAWGAIHRGRTYLFVGPEQREKFLANPDLYSPVMSGIDPVLALDNQMMVSGRREFGVFGADRRIYLFADEASLKRFEQNPKRYAAEAIQARR
jgi:thiol-disulfide isomerase/thioredoxin/YHS domain-containing protein